MLVLLLLILSVLTIRSITNVAVSPLPNIVRAIHGILGRIRQNHLLVARISLPLMVAQRPVHVCQLRGSLSFETVALLALNPRKHLPHALRGADRGWHWQGALGNLKELARHDCMAAPP